MPQAKRRLKNFDFTSKDSHIALVDSAANGLSVLVKKRFSDMEKYDHESGDFIPLEESGLKVSMSLEDILLFFTDLFPEDIETLTASITKAKDGKELGDLLEEAVRKDQVMPFDVFEARREEFQAQLQKLDTGAMDALRGASIVINEFLDRGIKPGDTESGSPSTPDLVEKTVMTKEEKTAADIEKKAADTAAAAAKAASKDASEVVPANVQKSLDEQTATITKQAATIEVLQKAEDARVTATFITKAAGYVEKGASLPKVAEDKDATDEFGRVLKTLSEAAPEAYAQVESVLEAAFDTIAKGSNLEELGGDGQPESSDNASAIAKAATELRKEDSSLSESEAVTKALEINPELYEG